MTEIMHGRLRFTVEMFNRLVILAVAFCMIYFGFINFLNGFGNFRMPSMTPLASYYAAIPLSGVMIALFTIEQIVNGCRNGFDHPEPPEPEHSAAFGESRPGEPQ
jgi:TRAP-type C4-dicarboxylate transport system permease small subunit